MKRFAHIFLLMPLLLLAGACSGTVDDSPSDLVPEGVLRIFADKTSIAADGTDCVTFKVMYGSQDVSNASTMKLVVVSGGKETEMSRSVNTFTSVIAGEYEFYATYYSSGNHVSDNRLKITVVPVGGTGTSYRKVLLGMQFTSTGCSNCPTLSSALSKIQNNRPGEMFVVSFHGNYGGVEDEMTTQAYTTFYNYLGFQGLPFFSINMKKGDLTNVQAYIEAAMDNEFETEPSVCGVAIETSVVDRELSATVKITSNLAMSYRYHIFVVEDGVHSDYQAGISGTQGYTHNNVVRHSFSDTVHGIKLNAGDALTSDVEYTAKKTLELDSKWVLDNLRIVAAAMISSDGGKTWYCTCANSCKLGESADYQIAE